MSKENIIELADLTTGYGQHVVTSHINAVLRPGQLISLLGPNGVGKSTLLRTLGAFQPPLGGQIRVGGKPVEEMTSAQLSRIIGVVLTERPDIQNMTVRDMVSMGRSPYTGFWGRLTTDDEALVDEAMQQTGVTPLAARMINTLTEN